LSQGTLAKQKPTSKARSGLSTLHHTDNKPPIRTADNFYKSKGNTVEKMSSSAFAGLAAQHPPQSQLPFAAYAQLGQSHSREDPEITERQRANSMNCTAGAPNPQGAPAPLKAARQQSQSIVYGSRAAAGLGGASSPTNLHDHGNFQRMLANDATAQASALGPGSSGRLGSRQGAGMGGLQGDDRG